MFSIKKLKPVTDFERMLLALVTMLFAVTMFAVVASAHGQGERSERQAEVASTQSSVMGPAAPEVARVANTVGIPKELVAYADCFNIYRNGELFAACIKPSIDEAGDYYFIDNSPEIKPATRFTYSVSAVNATGESPRINQNGPYPSTGSK
jgi:hypothetical protein